MRALQVEFAAKRPVSPWLWGGLAAALCLLATQQGREGWALRQQTTAAENEASVLAVQLDRGLQAQRDAASQVRPEPAYLRDALAVAKVARFPVGRVLASLEATRVQGVKLTALDIFAAGGTARAELEFASHDALMRYLDDINAGEERPRWRLLQAQTATAGAGGSTATIGSNWNGGQ